MLVLKSTRVGRAGFTLIELLAVIFIIVILLAMGAGALHRAGKSQDIRRTETDMQKLASPLEQQWQAVLDQTGKQGQASQAVVALADGQARRARALWQLFNLKREFPQNCQEAVTNLSTLGVLPPHQTYVNELMLPGGSGVFQSVAPNAKEQYREESAVCLYLILTTPRGGVSFNPSTIGATGIGSVTLAGGGTTKKFSVFLDSWQKPIAFVRWTVDPVVLSELDSPTYVASLNYNNSTNNPNPSYSRIDPEGVLFVQSSSSNTPPFWSQSNKTNSALALRQNMFNSNLYLGSDAVAPPQTPSSSDPVSSFNWFPLINHNYLPYLLSSGPNKQFETATDSSDDIPSYRLRQQGGRGN